MTGEDKKQDSVKILAGFLVYLLIRNRLKRKNLVNNFIERLKILM